MQIQPILGYFWAIFGLYQPPSTPFWISASPFYISWIRPLSSPIGRNRHNLCRLLIVVTNPSLWQWSHVIDMWKPDGRRKVGRLRTTWRRTVEKERNELGWKSWNKAKRVARNRGSWKESTAILWATGPEEDRWGEVRWAWNTRPWSGNADKRLPICPLQPRCWIKTFSFWTHQVNYCHYLWGGGHGVNSYPSAIVRSWDVSVQDAKLKLYFFVFIKLITAIMCEVAGIATHCLLFEVEMSLSIYVCNVF